MVAENGALKSLYSVYPFDEQDKQELDPRRSEKSDPDPHKSEKSDPDPHKSEKSYPDPH